METQYNSQTFSASDLSGEMQQVPSVDTDEYNSPPQKGLNLRPLLRTIQRKALLITGITSVLAVIAVLLSARSPSTYQGNFRLLVEPVTSEAKSTEPGALTRGDRGSSQDSLDYPTQLEILQSPKMLSAIVEQVRVRYPNFSYAALQKGLLVTRLGKGEYTQTKVIEVSYLGQNPELVQFVLEATAERYLKYSLEERKTRIGEGVKFIEEQLPPLQKRVETLKSDIQRMQQQYQITDPRTQGDQVLVQLRQITEQQLETERQLKELRTLSTNLQKQLELTPNEAMAASSLSGDPNYQGLRAKIKEIEGQIAVESARFEPNSPSLQVLIDKRQNLIALLNQETQRILGKNIRITANNSQVLTFQTPIRQSLIQQLVETNNKIQLLEVHNQTLTQTRNIFTQQAQQFPAVARRYSDLQRQLEMATKTLDQLVTQRETLRIEAAQKQVPWELISDPQIPRNAAGKPVPYPNSNKKLQMAVGGGLLLGLVLAIFIEKYRDIFYTSEDVKDTIKSPLLGVIPLYKIPDKSHNYSAIVAPIEKNEGTNSSAALFLEAFDSLYASIRFLYAAPPIRSLVVCSAAPGDGKSTIALHLAQTAAAMGQRVLLVDANLRSPQLHSWLDLPNLKGLSDLLYSKLDPNVAIQRSPLINNLFVLTSGQPLPDSTKLLASTQMQYLMKDFRATFDLVIYDTPNLSGFMDARFLAAHTEGILMVVTVRNTKCSAVKQVINQLNTFRLPILGVVANH